MNRTETLPCANCDAPVEPAALVCPNCGARFAAALPPEALLNVVRIAEYAAAWQDLAADDPEPDGNSPT